MVNLSIERFFMSAFTFTAFGLTKVNAASQLTYHHNIETASRDIST
ncbi:Uncharacterised protein [Vibrio cholerae]|nr:Uncharacterised protein [Vibrio cholerae]